MAKGDKIYFIENEAVMVAEDSGDGTSALNDFHPGDEGYEEVLAEAKAYLAESPSTA